ncbi:VanZ family protein [Niallia endozanthoxylica]|uniref:VanZ family protein n=1 Tax=Niallia endozanthoxylica TaxID=2036016 RepID=UPI00168A7C4A
MIQKVGHILSFFLLRLLALQCFHSYQFCFVTCIWYGYMTELFQLFFVRAGRLFDVGFYAVGVLSGLFLSAIIMQIKRNAAGQVWRDSDPN